MIGIDGFHIRLVELLNQRKDETGITQQLVQQIRAAGGDELPGPGGAQDAAVLKGITSVAKDRKAPSGGKSRTREADDAAIFA